MGRTPPLYYQLNGRLTIAEVESTCGGGGAGCGWLGATGIEMQSTYFEEMYRYVADETCKTKSHSTSSAATFWFWFGQRQFKDDKDNDPVVTGYAVWMRFESMDAAAVRGASYNGMPFDTFRQQITDLARQYEADPSLTFAGTLARGQAPGGVWGGADSWASLVMQLTRLHGGQTFKVRFWRRVDMLPTTTTTAQAVANWQQAAGYAACADLSAVFYKRWGFPRPDGTVTTRLAASTVPEPGGSCGAGGATNLVVNPSLEADTAGWGAVQGTLSRVAVTGAPDGAYVAKGSCDSGSSYSIGDDQASGTPAVPSTTAAATYVATAYVKAASSSAVGKPIQLIVRERTPAGAVVRETKASGTLGTSFKRIGVAAAAVGTGNSLGVRIVQTSAAAGNALYADMLTLRTTTAVAGATQPGTAWTPLYTNVKRTSAYALSVSQSADVTALRAYIDGRGATSGSQPVRGVIYADASGAPGAVVARTNELSVTAGRAAGWATLAFSAPVRLQAGRYWLGRRGRCRSAGSCARPYQGPARLVLPVIAPSRASGSWTRGGVIGERWVSGW